MRPGITELDLRAAREALKRCGFPGNRDDWSPNQRLILYEFAAELSGSREPRFSNDLEQMVALLDRFTDKERVTALALLAERYDAKTGVRR